jgi:hypothetical protein
VQRQKIAVKSVIFGFCVVPVLFLSFPSGDIFAYLNRPELAFHIVVGNCEHCFHYIKRRNRNTHTP